MKTRTLRNIGVFFFALSLLSSCQKEEVCSENLSIYLRNVKGNSMYASYETNGLAKNPIEITGANTFEHDVEICVSRNLIEDAHIILGVDENAVEAYNTSMNQQAILLPDDAYTLSTSELVIPSGSSKAHVKVNIPDMSILSGAQTYVLPLTVKSIKSEDKGLTLSKARSTVFVTVKVNLAYIDWDVKTIEGEPMSSTGWNISSSAHDASYTADLAFDSDLRTAYVYKGANRGDFYKANIVVDFKTLTPVSGFRIFPNNSVYDSNYNGSVIAFEFSKDGKTWIHIGTSPTLPGTWDTWNNFDNPPAFTYVQLYSPQETRYVRFSWTYTHDWMRKSTGVGEISIY